MSCYVDVLPDPGRAFSQLFTYSVPERLRATVRVGAQVLVPFGPRTVVGVVAGLKETTDRSGLKEIESVLEDAPALPEDALPLARWIADYYLCELGEALRPFLPGGATYRIGRRFRLTGEEIPPAVREHPEAGLLARHLEKADGGVGLAALRRVLPAGKLARALRLLKARRLVEESASLLPPRARMRQVRVVEVSPDEVALARYCEAKARSAPARVACLRAAMETGPIRPAELAERAGVSVSAVNALVKEGLLRARWRPVRRMPWREAMVEAPAPVELTTEQGAALRAISEATEAGGFESFLLYGVTASGKTEVFLRAIERVLARGRQAIVLLPEISLTAQAVGIYRARFGDKVAILHSGLSVGERWDEWQRIRIGEAPVVIGARSALFAPTPSLGLIVVDEEHEPSYKQEQAPRYHAREVALKRGELAGCPVVLASATPALESFWGAQSGRHRLLRLPTRVEDRPLPKVRVVDMRGGGGRILSSPLRQAMQDHLKAGEQVIVFLNRRGYSTFLLCPACGESVRCPDCQVALIYHKQEQEVRCHHCGLARESPSVCARCGGHHIRFSGFGTERVERELRETVPLARPERMDRDTTARKGEHVRIVRSFRTAESNVLIGTQMVAKGFDFPGVTLVGVISADTSLNLPDFRAAERTFQLLTQVSGRCGRGEKEGDVIVQTYQPDHYSIEAAAKHDYETFYAREVEGRQELNYPPVSHLINVVVSGEKEAEVASSAQRLAEEIRRRAAGTQLELLGPAEAPIPKLRGRYRWHVIVRGQRGEGQEVLREMLAGISDWTGVSVAVDVDPVSLM